MAYLEKFEKNERDEIVRLPYLAGLWVSDQDETGGRQSSFKERLAMIDIIKEKSTGMFDSAFVHEVMADLFLQKESWPEWTYDEEHLFQSLEAVPPKVLEKLSAQDARVYAQNIMDVAYGVADAYREFDDSVSFGTKMFTKLKLKIDKILGMLTKQDFESERLLNISIEEDIALGKLSAALQKNITVSDSDTSHSIAS